jgi:hypothetical protein
MYQVTELETGREIQSGDTVTSFRGEPWTFLAVTRGPSFGKSAKVLAAQGDWQQELYAEVFDLVVR